jgi:streptogrisin C
MRRRLLYHLRRGSVTALVATLGVLALGAPRATAAARDADETAIEFVVNADGVPREEAVRRLAAQERQTAIAERLGRELGDRSAGAWIDRRTDELVVNVLDDRAAATVREAGARPALVRNPLPVLEAQRARLDQAAQSGGSGQVDSWYVDVQDNVLVATVPDGADDPATARFLGLVREAGALAVVRPSEGRATTLSQDLYAGGAEADGTLACSIGFAARDAANNRYMITASHCVWSNPNLSVFGLQFGQTSYFGAAYDEAAVLNWYPSFWLQQPKVWPWNGGPPVSVVGYSQAPKNAVVCKSGTTSFYTCGFVTDFNVTKASKFPDGVIRNVFGLTKTTTCAKPGDSGGPFVAGNWAQGTTEAGALYAANGAPWSGSGPAYCGAEVGKPTVTYFQPIGSTLWRSGLSLVV